jgi:hypothetical protein
MQGSSDKRTDDSSGTDADAVFGDFTVPEDADVQSGEPDAENDEPGRDPS